VNPKLNPATRKASMRRKEEKKKREEASSVKKGVKGRRRP